MQLLQIYEKLLSHFGQQNWWPVSDEGKLKATYEPRSKLSAEQKFEICVGAILTQNTAWKNVEKAIENLKKAKVLTPEKITKMQKRSLAKLIAPSGFFNQKGAYLRNFCKFWIACGQTQLFELPAEQLRKELLSVKGVGRETADSVVLYAAGKPKFVVDAYTKRIVERVYSRRFSGYEDLQQFFESNLPQDAKLFNEFHALLVALGKEICLKKKPLCENCQLRKGCNDGSSMALH